MLKPEEIRSVQFEDSYYPVIDGVVQVVHNYAKLMNQQSYSCVVCPKASPEFDDGSLPYDVYRMPSVRSSLWQYSVAVPGSLKGLEEMISVKKPNILHVHSPFSQRTAALKLAEKYHIPLVTTFHTKYYDDVYQVTKSRFLAQRVISNILRFYDRCDSVWACSKGTADTLRSYGYQGEIRVMINGTDYKKPEDPEAAAKKAAAHFSLRTDKKTLLFVGTQVWQKNIRLILDTMKLLCEKREDMQLLLVGTGSDENAIHKYTAELGLSNEQVIPVGKVTDPRLLSGLFLNADLFFFPSVYDNAPIVVREAATLERAILLTKDSNAADVIEPDVNGFIAEESPEAMAEKILSVIDDTVLLQKVGQEASRTIPIPWEDLIPEVYQNYAEIIDRYQK